MEREMQQLKVFVNDRNYICISQENIGTDDDEVVWIHPDQVDLLIKWLQEARSEL